ncbi:thioredoxin [Helicobacter ailurogastricus]|uniref:Thioredoxin n=1 Tax=Helicobacter ailurogastricus TaxID=1578720 RepID=A0A0K2X472_9HELI|nr:thioredoxin [Helicobacter ailurogastricus]CRF41122.1 Thioredoxin [Helicobacter ailurogastricus]CRF42083.1 Thioredoxin [Helicobacter ailurogastricus]CRF44962.1 Thioredoxin [Helicobacter ailurogastricus]GLH58698.1 Thioredoxin TrxA [Helicobacter ailurogastricus]GLH59477.1 Thioredoxin TrxA [Helicobacter ailurogastricus]
MSGYIELTDKNFDSETKNGAVVVDFWAPWCGPCKMLSPIIDELASEYTGRAKICKVNTDEQEELSARFGIRSIPTVLYMKDGQVLNQTVGALSKQSLKDNIDKLL